MQNNRLINDVRCLTKTRLPIRVLTALFAVVTVCAQRSPNEPNLQGDGNLKVMTYNMYAGSEYAGVTDPDLDYFLAAVDNLIVDARASDPPGRTLAMARQIAANKPHLVGLQEVATWSSGTTKENLTVEFDFLQLLLDALAAQGAPYNPVVTLTTWDATVPGTVGFVRNTWRVVILARANLKPDNLRFTNAQAATWTATLPVPIPALDGQSDLCPGALDSSGSCVMPFPRGWASTDVSYRGKQFRFIAAHLDKNRYFEPPQGAELLNSPADSPLPVIVAADLNCDLSNPGDRNYPTCDSILNAGFTDAWTAANPFEPGYTKDLPVMTQRGDYVMFRGLFGAHAAALVGEEFSDTTPAGLYPSNHAGVVVRLDRPEEE